MGRAEQTPPEAMQVVLRYANSELTQENWREVIATGFEPVGTARMQYPDMEFTEAAAILRKFRSLLDRLVVLDLSNESEAVACASELSDAAQLRVKRFGWDSATGQLVPRWDPEKKPFHEELHGQLIVALQETPLRSLHRCSECGTFFYDRSRRPARYCSQACRSQGSSREFRKGIVHRRRAKQRSGLV